MHSVLLFLDTLIPPRFDCIDRHQHLLRLSLWLARWLIQSRDIWCSTYIPRLWAFQIPDAIVLLYNRFIVCRAIVFNVIWIIQVPIPVKPIFGVWDVFRHAILITFAWMTFDLCDLVDIIYLTSSSRQVLCRQCWWQRWSIWQCKCSRTIMMKVWPGCFHDPFRIRSVL